VYLPSIPFNPPQLASPSFRDEINLFSFQVSKHGKSLFSGCFKAIDSGWNLSIFSRFLHCSILHSFASNGFSHFINPHFLTREILSRKSLWLADFFVCFKATKNRRR
jgi:hypothetical protein